jgi:hypothetical protein
MSRLNSELPVGGAAGEDIIGESLRGWPVPLKTCKCWSLWMMAAILCCHWSREWNAGNESWFQDLGPKNGARVLSVSVL